MSRSVVVVESPSKAKTIGKYLGPDYTVLASYGHVRDLPAKNGSVDPKNDFRMLWELNDRATQHMKNIQTALKNADKLYLATDPDREGEAISWHVAEVLREHKSLSNAQIQRIVFHEITPKAVRNAIEHPRDIDQSLVDAYKARRALDYLVGFTLSPVLWRKLPGARSAGRVQSVALRLIVDREQAIEVFISQDYWTVDGAFQTPQKQEFTARLTHTPGGKKIDKFDLKNQQEVDALCENLQKGIYAIQSLESKQVKRHPAAPFTTSTLQQEAARKAGFGASRTMQVAQKLYEGISIRGETIGLITYMRTDSVNLSEDAIKDARTFIGSDYGKNYVPAQPRIYKTKAKNAQEAHEAIRPTHLDWKPQDIKSYLNDDQFKLYDLIWKRTLASQMESALFDQVSADVAAQDVLNKGAIFRATGSTLAFDGFLKVYEEGKDEEDQTLYEDQDRRLPALKQGDDLKTQEVKNEQHATQPPPRFTEASLVKKLEELGIGRPSTYAPLLQVLQDRTYVTLEKRQFFPSDRGRVVTSFLIHYFAQYIADDFTANMEEKLDTIADGDLSWLKVVGDFWTEFNPSIAAMDSVRITEVIDILEDDLAHFLFQDKPKGERYCPHCESTMGRTPETGQLHLKLSKFGAFLGCSLYPTCNYTQKLTGSSSSEDESDQTPMFEPVVIGEDPTDGASITARKGPYGFYLQWDGGIPAPEEVNEEEPKKKKSRAKKAAPKIKRVSIPMGMDWQTVDVSLALKLKSLPFELGKHPETELLIKVGSGRFGPYVQYDGMFASIPKSIYFLDITIDQAVQCIEAKKQRALKKASTSSEFKKTPSKTARKKA